MDSGWVPIAVNIIAGGNDGSDDPEYDAINDARSCAVACCSLGVSHVAEIVDACSK